MQLLAGYEQSNYDHLWHCTSWQTRAWSTVIEILCIHSFIFSKEKKKSGNVRGMALQRLL